MWIQALRLRADPNVKSLFFDSPLDICFCRSTARVKTEDCEQCRVKKKWELHGWAWCANKWTRHGQEHFLLSSGKSAPQLKKVPLEQSAIIWFKQTLFWTLVDKKAQQRFNQVIWIKHLKTAVIQKNSTWEIWRRILWMDCNAMLICSPSI